MKKLLLLVAIFNLQFSILDSVQAQAGIVDSTFGVNGVVRTSFNPTGSAICRNVIALPGGKIVATGSSFIGTVTKFAAVRYHNNGVIDSTFGVNGIAATAVNSTYSFSYCSVLQPDGKIVLGGDYFTATGYAFALVRYKTDGSLDSTFGYNGVDTFAVGTGSIDNSGRAIALQSNGKIILAGNSYNGSNYDFTVLRFNTNGAIDTTFGNHGVTVTPIGTSTDNCYAMTIQDDDKIILAGDIQNGSAYEFTVARYDANGNLDNSFGTGGTVTHPIGLNDDDYGYAVVMQPNHKVLVGGAAKGVVAYDFALMRLDSTGALDNTFGTGGFVLTDFSAGNPYDYGRDLALQSDGKILLGGNTTISGSHFGIVRFSADGIVDSTFGSNGRVYTQVGNAQHYGYGIAVDNNNKIILGGQATTALPDNFVLLRYTSGLTVGVNELLTASNYTTGIFIYPNPASKFFTVSWPFAENKNCELRICDVVGREVFHHDNILFNGGSSTLSLGEGWAEAGIYFIQLKTGNEIATQKFIIQK